jgi:hypothetical protein
MTPSFPKSGVRAGDHRDDAAIQYVPELGGDLVMGLPIQSGLVLLPVLLHFRGSKDFNNEWSSPARRALSNFGGKIKIKIKIRFAKLISHRCGTWVRHKKPSIVLGQETVIARDV